jgi:type II secretory pathway component PulK
MTMNHPYKQAGARAEKPRRGIILLAVLIALVLLTLAGYQYGDLMLAEYRAADNAHAAAQARALADSGIYYAAAMLADPNSGANNLWDNRETFHAIQIPTGDGSELFGRFTLIAPLDDYSGVRHGLVDEGAKLNLNVLMQLDPSGDRLYNALMALPNMTDDIANAIVDWLDADNTPRDGGAEDDYYSALSPPYHCKNGPLESIEELLLVRGVTPQLLFGGDLNRNGIIDPDEDSSNGLGWSAFLTIYSREQNSDPQGNAYINLNSSDLSTLYDDLSTVGDTLAKFVVLARQYGLTQTTPTDPSSSSSNNSSSGSSTPKASTKATGRTSGAMKGGKTGGRQTTQKSSASTGNASQGSSSAQKMGDLADATLDFTKPGKTNLTSIFQLINAQVTVPGSGNNNPSVTYQSPLADPSVQQSLLPLLFQSATLIQGNEIPARINVNTAPQEVLGTLLELADDDIQNILSNRPAVSSSEAPDPIFQTPAWLLVQGKLDVNTLIQLEPYITTRSQVFRVQSVGYFDNRGTAARVEAIIDINGGRPRILTWRDLTPLGKGWNGSD